jgi:excisionase family DNA binding protein
MARQRLTVRQAAEVLGTSVDAVRSRIRRGSIEAEKDAVGRVFVWLGDDQSDDKPESQGESSRELVEDLREQVRYLREQLREERRANDENRRLLAAALERIPALEPPVSSKGSERPEEGQGEDSEGPTTTGQGEGLGRLSWWRRFLGE